MSEFQREAQGDSNQPEEVSSLRPFEGNGDVRTRPDMTGRVRTDPDTTGQDRPRPVVSVDPSDDDYVFTAQSASVHSANKGIVISDRRFRRACDRENPAILKCVWKRVGNPKPQWYIGANSLEQFIALAKQSQALKSDSPDTTGQRRTMPDTSGHAQQQKGSEATNDVQELQDKLAMKEVELQVKTKLLEEERKARREDMEYVANLGQRIGELQEKNAQLQLSAGAQEIKPETVIDIPSPKESPIDRVNNLQEHEGRNHRGSETENL